MLVTGAKLSLATASSSGLPAVDLNVGGYSIFSTTPTIDVSEKTTATAATNCVLASTASCALKAGRKPPSAI